MKMYCNYQRDVITGHMVNEGKSSFEIRKVRKAISNLLPTGHPGLAEVAAQLGISPRTLQRRPAGMSLSHSQLVNQTRVTTACQRLAQRDVHISEIAREIGFATPSAFSRAFQSWTGKSPRDFRKAL